MFAKLPLLSAFPLPCTAARGCGSHSFSSLHFSSSSCGAGVGGGVSPDLATMRVEVASHRALACRAGAAQLRRVARASSALRRGLDIVLATTTTAEQPAGTGPELLRRRRAREGGAGHWRAEEQPGP